MKVRYVSTAVLALLSTAACGEILSIEEAFVDPSLGGQASGGGPSAGAPPGSGGNVAGTAPTGGQSGNSGASSGPTPCEQYCDELEQWCDSAQTIQYTDREQCLAVCSTYAPGDTRDREGNTLGCRYYHASRAKYEQGPGRASYCRWAGANSDGACGSNCEGFCSVMMATCTEAIAGVHHYATTEECLDDCATLDQIPYLHGDDSVADSDTLQCRLFHVMSAAVYDPEEHCGHAMGFTLCAAQGGAGSQ